jgi:hypothetical protein
LAITQSWREMGCYWNQWVAGQLRKAILRDMIQVRRFKYSSWESQLNPFIFVSVYLQVHMHCPTRPTHLLAIPQPCCWLTAQPSRKLSRCLTMHQSNCVHDGNVTRLRDKVTPSQSERSSPCFLIKWYTDPLVRITVVQEARVRTHKPTHTSVDSALIILNIKRDYSISNHV